MDSGDWIFFLAGVAATATLEAVRLLADRGRERKRELSEQRREAVHEEKSVLVELQAALEELRRETEVYLGARAFGSRRPGPGAAQAAWRKTDVVWARLDHAEVREAAQKFVLKCVEVLDLEDLEEIRGRQRDLRREMASGIEWANEAIAARLRELSHG